MSTKAHVAVDRRGRPLRLAEATAIRTDEAALGPNARVLYVGDFNVYKSTDAVPEERTSAEAG